MNRHSFAGLTRVSKRAARKIWGTDKTISLCPANLCPDGPWRVNLDVFPEEQKARAFDEMVNSFEFYNCNMNETGYYTAFYIRHK